MIRSLRGRPRAAAVLAVLACLVPSAGAAPTAGVRHYEYVFTDGNLDVYDMDRSFALVRHVSLPPTSRGIRGACASARTGMLYVSYGGDGGVYGNGAMLKYDLRRNTILWTREYPFGIDSMAIDPRGRVIYMPDGELARDGRWYAIDARSGDVTGHIDAGAGAHNTIVSRTGKRVYLGGRSDNRLFVAQLPSRRVVKKVGPLVAGVRPFTVNGRETIAYTTATRFLGFQVSSLVTGRVLYTVTFPGFSWNPATFGPSAPSHGISLSPDERWLYVMDAPNEAVHVFDVGSVPRRRPRMVDTVRLTTMRGTESPCKYDCARDGWISHSRDGRFVFVGDAGDVIDARTRRIVRNIPTLANTRKYIEVDFDDAGNVVWAARNRASIGFKTARRPS